MDVKECIELLYNLKILDKKLLDLFEKKIGISLTRFQIIKYLHESSFCTSKQISQTLEIEKRRNENNNREILIELSEKAIEDIYRCEQETNVQDIIGNEFTEKDLKDLVILLNKFNKNFK